MEDKQPSQTSVTLTELKDAAVKAVDEQELLEKSYFFPDKETKMKALFTASQDAISAYEQKKLEQSEDNTLGRRDKSLIWTLRGKALVYEGSGQSLKKAEEFLQKVVKLSPSEVKAWNILAHLEWIRKDLTKAKQYLQSSMERNDKDKDTLTMLSILYRAIPETQEHKIQNIKYSLELAHKAVSIDLGNSEAWCVLGTAHLQNFFMVDTRYQQLEKALKAYQQAQKCMTWKNPDLFYNYATVLSFLEAYAKAVSYFYKAHEVDPTLGSNKVAEALQTFVILTANYVSGKAKVKELEKHKQKLKSFSQEITTTVTDYMKQEIVPIMKAQHGAGFNPEEVKTVSFKEIGENCSYGIFVCRVLKLLQKEQVCPVSFLVVDSQMQYGVISLYNTTAKYLEGELKFGTEVLVARPNKIEVVLTRDEKIYLYEVVRVTNLGMMFVDGKPLSDKGQPMSVVSETFSGKKLEESK